jgi:hypothetical protein
MRKWVVIALIAVSAVCAIAFVLSRPRKGSVQYHKKAFLEAHYSGRLTHWILAHAPKELRSAYSRRQQDQIEFHRRSLVELGFLTERVFVISNQPSEVANLLRLQVQIQGGSLVSGQINFAVVRDETTNSVKVTARPADMVELEELIREADLREKANVLQ